MDTLEPCDDLRLYFQGEVSLALNNLELEAEPETEFYLVNLLAEFATDRPIEGMSRPLAQQLADALDQEGRERMYQTRYIGDVALFMSGFLPDSLERRGVTETYVASVGGQAYWVAGETARDATLGNAWRVLFDLGERFRDFARVLDEVREQGAGFSDADVLRLYERWCESGSPALARRLQRRGLSPQPPGRIKGNN